MASPAIALGHARVRPSAPAWIIGPGTDLTCLVGGALVAYAFLAAHLFFGVAAVTIYMVWILAIDGPHVFATLSRTYLDDAERVRWAPLLRWSLAFFALGPAAVAASALVGRRLPYDAFLLMCTLWAYWHVVRQHYGVMVLYKKKADDLAPTDDRIDAAVLYIGLLAPIVSFAVTNARTLAMIGIDAAPPWAQTASTAAWSVFAIALVALAGRQLVRWRAGDAVNGTKLLFVAAAISVSAVLFSPPVAARIQYEAVFPIVTSFHNVQYLAIVWFFHRNRVAATPRRRNAALPPLVARSLVVFLVAGVLFTIGYRVVLGCVFSAWPGCDVGAQDLPLAAGLTVSDLGVGFLWGFALHHYYLDQKIWHVRRDPAVGRDLRLDAVRA